MLRGIWIASLILVCRHIAPSCDGHSADKTHVCIPTSATPSSPWFVFCPVPSHLTINVCRQVGKRGGFWNGLQVTAYFFTASLFFRFFW
ncbi:hypothetical protein F5X96DRAFT_613130, partial [Biscogniauxia mediterranea]